MPKKQLNFRVDSALQEAIQKAAAAEGQTVTEWLKAAAWARLKQEEEVELSERVTALEQELAAIKKTLGLHLSAPRGEPVKKLPSSPTPVPPVQKLRQVDLRHLLARHGIKVSKGQAAEWAKAGHCPSKGPNEFLSELFDVDVETKTFISRRPLREIEAFLKQKTGVKNG